IYHYWKKLTKGKKLWLRNNFSTITSQFFDTCVVLLLLCFGNEIPWEQFGTLLLMGEAAERGLSKRQDLRLVDRRRLDAIFLAREEVRHEDYLDSDRDAIAAIGAEYLLIGRIVERQADIYTDGPSPTARLAYNVQLSVVQVSTSSVLASTRREYDAFADGVDPDDLSDRIIGQLERSVAAQVEQLAEEVAAVAFTVQGRSVEWLEVLEGTRNKVERVLLATDMNVKRLQKFRVYYNQYYEVNGEQLGRPIYLGVANVVEVNGQLLTCTILSGGREMQDALEAGHTLLLTEDKRKS
ncbi:MAG: VUT family protein, partial [Bacteroidota bacterium]